MEWTFTLRKGVPFHFGFGQFTAKDVVHSHSMMLRPEATATLAGFWRNVEEVKVVNDHEVVFRMKRPTTDMLYGVSRAGDLRMVSKAQWDKEGIEGFDKRPAGTGSYRYVGRQPGLNITFERVDNHWAGEKPAFKELEFRLAREESTRLALLLSGEAHIADLPRELQKDAIKRGMKIFSSSYPVDWMTVYLGGLYLLPGRPGVQGGRALDKKPVRQALNMAINRKELLNTVFAGKGTMTYVTGWSEKSEGYNPEWKSRFDQMYGYNPGKAKDAPEAGRLRPRPAQDQDPRVHRARRVGRAAGGRSAGHLLQGRRASTRRSRWSTGPGCARGSARRRSGAASGPTSSRGGRRRSGSGRPTTARARTTTTRPSSSRRPTTP